MIASDKPMLNTFWRTLGSLAAGLLSLSSAECAPTGEAAAIIHFLKMEKIPGEGPWFTLTYRSADMPAAGSLPARYEGVPHVSGSAIYTLQTKEDFSAFHVLQTDELWHFYGGSPLETILLYPDGHGERLVLGSDILHGQRPQIIVPRGVWQASRPIGEGPETYTFFGNTLAPGFEYSDFRIGYRDELQKQYPGYKQLIAELTRDEFAVRPPSAPPAPGPSPAEQPVFGESEAPVIAAAPGLRLQELVGREGKSQFESCSIAAFTLSPGHATPESYNQVSTEFFLILSGHGEVILDGAAKSVSAGSTVVIKPRVRHALRAAADAELKFYAISAPAYSPTDYILVPSK